MESNIISSSYYSFALNLNPDNILNDVLAVMETPSYDDSSAHQPLNKMACSFHPQWRDQVCFLHRLIARTLKCLLGDQVEQQLLASLL